MDDVAQVVLYNSLNINKREKIYILSTGESPLVDSLIKRLTIIGAYAYVKQIKISELKSLINYGNSSFFRNLLKHELKMLHEMDAFIGVTHDINTFEMNEIDNKNHQSYYKYFYEPIMKYAQQTNRWILIHAPSIALSQLSKQSSKEINRVFEDSIIKFDYKRFYKRAVDIMKLLENTNEVKIIAPNTNLKFSIQGIDSDYCDGKHNLPGGEVFTAPNLSTVHGYINFNVPFNSFGVNFDFVTLEYTNGELTYFNTSNNKRFKEILDSDHGANYFGEFGIGLNPYIIKPFTTSAYDEKMLGSIHLALGQSYKSAYNYNDSTVHMDLVLSLLERDGGGEIYFDNSLIMKDGVFIK
ncbi:MULTISPECIES: aminopeptidase [Oceanobacillus]|uniref:aminopeptidase n=1 Tax=Oceanobacillus TaxID=182709 RepID=UPI0030F65A02